MDKLLLPPDETGYSVAENADSLLSQDLDGGRPRQRLDQVGDTRLINLQWSGSKKRYTTVRKFFNDNLGQGCPQFLMDLIAHKSDYAEYTCSLVDNTIKTNVNSDLGWTIAAQFEVEPRDDEDLALSTDVLDSPDFAGYSITDGNERVGVNYGVEGVYRRNYLNGCSLIDVGWQTDAAGYDKLAKSYRFAISQGGASLQCDILLDDTLIERYKVGFVKGSFGLKSVQGLTYSVQAQLIADKTVYDVAINPWATDPGLTQFKLSAVPSLYVLNVIPVNFKTSTIHAPLAFGLYVMKQPPVALVYSATITTKLTAAFGSFVMLAQPIAFIYNQPPLKFNTQTASYTLVASDMDNRTWVRMNVATANNLTVPPQSSVPAAIGTTVLFSQYGSGLTTVVAGAGVTLDKSRTLVTAGHYSAGGITKTGADEWEVFGDLT